MAELRSLNDILYEKEINRKVETQRHRKTAKMERLSRTRRNWNRNYLHWASRRIIDFIASAGITTLVVGKNVGWKQECDMNKVNTQNFVSASGKKINADLNAALNMIRKVIPNAFQAQGIEALVVAPVRLLWRTKPEIGAFH